MSVKHKLNTRSSTEDELVGIHDIFPHIIWIQQLMQAQGYIVPTSMLYQDNKSTMTLDVKGKSSSSKRTRHMNIRYYYIKSKVDDGSITI